MNRTPLFLLVLLLAAAPFSHAKTKADKPVTDTPSATKALAPAAPSAPAAIASPTPAATNATDASAPATSDTPASAPSSPSAANASGQPSASPQEDIVDIRPPFFYQYSPLWWWIPLGIVVTGALALLLWKWFQPQLSPKTAYELTLEKLEKARGLMQEENPMPYAILISETIRTYLGQRFKSPSTRRTTEEFLKQMENDPATPLAEHRELLREFLQSCDLVKFARYQPTLAELEQVQERATTFVTATKPVPVTADTKQATLRPA